jgi:hypothetical protein
MERGRLIVWVDDTDAPVAVRRSDGLPVEVIFHHKNYVSGRVVHAVHVRVLKLEPVFVYYELDALAGEQPLMMPVRDCAGYRDVLCALGVEYSTSR